MLPRGKSFLGPLADSGFRPSRALGQNFILDSSLLDFIVRSSGASVGDTVLEIGAGAGQLTGRLAAAAANVVSFEIDPRLASAAARSLGGAGNVSILNADALAGKNALNPEIAAAVAAARAGSAGKLLLVSNLAYSIATPVVVMLLESGMPFESMTVTVQWELAERLCASMPGDPGYGPVSLSVGWFGRASVIRAIPPEAFWPRPKVRSALVRIEVDAAARAKPGYADFKEIVRAAFGHRRKAAAAAIASSGLLGRDASRRLFQTAGIDPMLRAEQIAPAGFVQLSAAFASADGSRD